MPEELNEEDEDINITPIFDAIENRDVKRIKKIIEEDPGILLTASALLSSAPSTPFEFFLFSDVDHWDRDSFVDLRRFFLDKKAPVNEKLGNKTLLHHLRRFITLEEFLAIKEEVGADINTPNENGVPLIFNHIQFESEILYELLSLKELDLLLEDNQGNNVVHCAALCKNVSLLKKLKELDLDINKVNKAGLTPFANMTKNKAIEDDVASSIALFLLENGGLVDINKPDANVPVIKSSSLGYRQDSKEAVVLFDKIVSELKDQIIVKKVKEGGKKIGKEIRADITRRIPKEENSPEFLAFAQVLGKVYSFTSALGHKNTPDQISVMLVEMIEKMEGSWVKVCDSLKDYSIQHCRDIRDAVNGFIETVILPEIVQRTRSRSSQVDYPKIVEDLLPKVAEILMASRPMLTMLRLSSRWHSKLPELEEERTIIRTGTWEKAAPDFTASNGYVITFLNTAKQLSDEGDVKNLNHCVGGYSNSCQNKGTHIASIRKVTDDNGETLLVPVSTVEFQEQPTSRDSPLKIVQHRGYGDDNILHKTHLPEAIALKEFMTRIDHKYTGKDKITIDFARINKRREEIKNSGKSIDVSGIIGYDPFAKTAPDEQDKFFKLYLGIHTQEGHPNSFVPGGNTKWGDKTAEDFLKETGLLDKVIEISGNPPLLGKTFTKLR